MKQQVYQHQIQRIFEEGKIKLLLSTSSRGRTYQLQIRHRKMIPSNRCIHNYPSVEDNACLKGRGMLNPKCWAQSPLQCGTLPLYGGVLHIIDVGFGLLVSLLVFIVHLCLLCIGRIYFHVSHHCILSCLRYTVHCVKRFLP